MKEGKKLEFISPSIPEVSKIKYAFLMNLKRQITVFDFLVQGKIQAE
jgi:hypothetical protein